MLRATTIVHRIRLMAASTNLFWLDAEMTGLNYQGKDQIMEIACLVTDDKLNIIHEGPEMIFNISETLLESMDEWCTKTHGESGLTAKCKKSTMTIEEGDQIVSEFIKQYCPNAPLAGNSVHMDACFMRKEMPLSMNGLSYRIVDVSSVKELCKRWYPNVYNDAPSKDSKVYSQFCQLQS